MAAGKSYYVNFIKVGPMQMSVLAVSKVARQKHWKDFADVPKRKWECELIETFSCRIVQSQ